MKVLVTGATGFLGSALCRWLDAAGHQVVAASRRPTTQLPDSIATVSHGELGLKTDWHDALQGIDVVVHCAARAHVMNETVADPWSLYQGINRDGTLALAQQAAQQGIKRFIFISSIKVNGEGTQIGQPYTVLDQPAPVDPYGQSKAEAEAGLRALATSTPLEYTIIRPPLIYGPGVKANFAALIRAVQQGKPLPLGCVRDNRRSLVALDNLLSLIQTCLDHPNAANQTFLVSDGEDLSSAELAKRIGKACGRPARLLPVPIALMKIAATVLGKSAMVQRLTGSLQVDIEHTRTQLGWKPVISVDEGLRRAISSALK